MFNFSVKVWNDVLKESTTDKRDIMYNDFFQSNVFVLLLDIRNM